MSDADVVVVGAGQAGLAVSHELAAAGVEHVVLERSRVGQGWRNRWDSFCLVTPNWTMDLPGLPYDGPEPEGFEPRDRIVAYLERYAASFSAPVHEGVEVRRLERGKDGGFLLQSSDGDINAATVVLATGAYQRPHRPPMEGRFPSGLLCIDSDRYTNPAGLPPGRVLVAGSGQTGCQIAEELHLAGREVFLACGRAGWLPRRLEGRDIVSLLSRTPFFELPLGALPSTAARLLGNPQMTGRDGGHDLNYRTLQAMGVRLLGRLTGVEGRTARFAPDLAASVAFGDSKYMESRQLIIDHVPDVPPLPEPEPFSAETVTELDLDGFGAVVFTSGFRPDFARWVDLPAFDEMGFPVTTDGASTAVPGLYFAGVHFLRKRKSSLLWGVGEDAALVASAIAQRHGAAVTN